MIKLRGQRDHRYVSPVRPVNLFNGVGSLIKKYRYLKHFRSEIQVTIIYFGKLSYVLGFVGPFLFSANERTFDVNPKDLGSLGSTRGPSHLAKDLQKIRPKVGFTDEFHILVYI